MLANHREHPVDAAHLTKADSMSRQAVKQKYIAARGAAYRATVETLHGKIDAPFSLSEMSLRSDRAWSEQWVSHPSYEERSPPNGGWDWPLWRHNYINNLDRFELAVWSGDRLAGLALGTLTKQAHRLLVAEGDPRPENPARGQLLLIILQAATLYAQRTGRKQLHLVEPANQALTKLYTSVYGFTLVKVRGEAPYCMREV